jgi:hypothetical protein
MLHPWNPESIKIASLFNPRLIEEEALSIITSCLKSLLSVTALTLYSIDERHKN